MLDLLAEATLVPTPASAGEADLRCGAWSGCGCGGSATP